MNHSLWQRAVTRRTVSSLIIGAATLALGTAFVTDSQAQSNFPSQTIRIVTGFPAGGGSRSEEHTSELQSLMRISYAVFCLKKKNKNHYTTNTSMTNQLNIQK